MPDLPRGIRQQAVTETAHAEGTQTAKLGWATCRSVVKLSACGWHSALCKFRIVIVVSFAYLMASASIECRGFSAFVSLCGLYLRGDTNECVHLIVTW